MDHHLLWMYLVVQNAAVSMYFVPLIVLNDLCLFLPYEILESFERKVSEFFRIFKSKVHITREGLERPKCISYFTRASKVSKVSKQGISFKAEKHLQHFLH